MSAIRIVKVDDIKNDAEGITCPVERSLYLVNEFLSGPMCGKCFPCSMGSYEARIRLNNLFRGNGSDDDLQRIQKIADQMLIASMCKKGKDVAKYILEWHDKDVFSSHVAGRCPEQTCKALIEYRIVTEKCTMCGNCLDACKYGAIHGEKVKPFTSGYHPFAIRRANCVKCGECIKVCQPEAIILVNANIGESVEV